MSNTPVRRALLCALALIAAAIVALPASAQTADPVRIMPLGDSITGSPGCWRALLYNQLVDAGHTDIDFVGTLPEQGCGIEHDGDNEGHGGFLATNIAAQNQLVDWLDATDPDIVIMHLGTNDVWSHLPTDQILAAFTTLVEQMRDHNPNMTILVAQIIPMHPDTCTDCNDGVLALNAAIPDWAAGLTTTASPITVVDQYTGFDTTTDTYDGVHPNDAGNVKIADAWFAALSAVLDGTTPTEPPTEEPTTEPTEEPTVAPTEEPTEEPTPSAGCSATYVVANSWPGGFQGEVRVTNTGDGASSGWQVTWTYGDGQQVTQSWQADVTQSGATVTAVNAAWNGALAPGATATFGFIGTFDGANSAPAVACTLG